MPGRKPTIEEVAERIEFCRSLLLRRVPKASIKKLFRQRFGAEINARTVEVYLSRAREVMLSDLGRGRQVHRASSLALYESVLAGPKAAARDKVKAQERIDKLLGLEDRSNRSPLELLLDLLRSGDAETLRRHLADRVQSGGDRSGPPGGAAAG